MEDSVRILLKDRWLEDAATTEDDDDANLANVTDFTVLEQAEEEHTDDAYTVVLMNVTLIACLLAAYYVRRFRIYYLPESALALLTGVVVGGFARLVKKDLQLFEFVSKMSHSFWKATCSIVDGTFSPTTSFFKQSWNNTATVPGIIFLCLAPSNYF